MIKVNIIHANQQASQSLHSDPRSHHPADENAVIHAGIFEYLSWAHVTEDVYFPTHRKGAFDLYIYGLTQVHSNGDTVDGHKLKAGDMLIMQSGSTDFPVVKRIGAGFSTFEFWFSESGLLQGEETPDFIKLSRKEFPVRVVDDVIERRLYGTDAPITHINDIRICELEIPGGKRYGYDLLHGRKAGIYVVGGNGTFNERLYRSGDFIELIQWEHEKETVFLESDPKETTHLIVIDLSEKHREEE